MHGVDWPRTGWRQSSILDWSLVPKGLGAYIIAAPQPGSRAVETDSEGYLDVGDSDNLANRHWSLQRCVSHRSKTGHVAGWRFAFIHSGRQFPRSELRVRWRTTASQEEACAAEGQVLLGYLRRHCELPPLNYKFNWQMFELHEWDVLDREAVQEIEPNAAPNPPDTQGFRDMQFPTPLNSKLDRSLCASVAPTGVRNRTLLGRFGHIDCNHLNKGMDKVGRLENRPLLETVARPRESVIEVDSDDSGKRRSRTIRTQRSYILERRWPENSSGKRR